LSFLFVQAATYTNNEDIASELAEQINNLKQKKPERVREQKMAAKSRLKLDDMDTCLKKIACEVRKIGNDLVRVRLQSMKGIIYELNTLMNKCSLKIYARKTA